MEEDLSYTFFETLREEDATDQEMKTLARYMRAKDLYDARNMDYSDLEDLWIDGCDIAAGESTMEGYDEACERNSRLWHERIKAKKAAKEDDSDEYAKEYREAKRALEEAIQARRDANPVNR